MTILNPHLIWSVSNVWFSGSIPWNTFFFFFHFTSRTPHSPGILFHWVLCFSLFAQTSFSWLPLPISILYLSPVLQTHTSCCLLSFPLRCPTAMHIQMYSWSIFTSLVYGNSSKSCSPPHLSSVFHIPQTPICKSYWLCPLNVPIVWALLTTSTLSTQVPASILSHTRYYRLFLTVLLASMLCLYDCSPGSCKNTVKTRSDHGWWNFSVH